MNDDTEAETTEAETTEPETTEDEAESLGDLELEVFKESLQGRSKNTITAYLGAFKRLKEALKKDIHDSSQELIIKTVEKMSTNLNTQASLINVGFLIRKGWNLDVKELVKARAVKKQGIIQYTKETNQSIADSYIQVYFWMHQVHSSLFLEKLTKNIKWNARPYSSRPLALDTRCSEI